MTFMGSHTADELLDYVATHDETIKDIGKRFADVRTAWLRTDLTGYTDFERDFNALKLRWAKAKAKALAEVESARNSIQGLKYTTVEPLYQETRKAVKQDPSNPAYSKGDLQDLYNRLVDRAGPFQAGQSYSKSDVDLDILKQADVTLKAIGKGASEGSETLLYGLGLLALIGIGIYAYEKGKR